MRKIPKERLSPLVFILIILLYETQINQIVENFYEHSLLIFVLAFLLKSLGTAVAQHCATNQKVAGSIPDGVIGIFH
jgi:hypothetical protein